MWTSVMWRLLSVQKMGQRHKGWMWLDSRFPHRQTSSGESRPVHLQLHHPEHRSPTGLCPEPPAILSLHHTTVCPLTAPLLLLHLLMILWFWASLTTMMRPHTWMRWRDLHHGARTTVSLWTWAKLKSWSWTSGRDSSGPTLLLWSVGPLWRGWAASSTSV